MSQATYSTTPGSAGQVLEGRVHPPTGGKSLSVLAANGIHVYESTKSLPSSKTPPRARYESEEDVVNFLAQHPERLQAVFDEDPTILEEFLDAEPTALTKYLQAKPAVLREFFEAHPDCLWSFLSSNPDKLSRFGDIHTSFMSKWLANRQGMVQTYLNDNPALFWNHIQAHSSFQSGGRAPFNNSFTAGLCYTIPEDQYHLIRNPVQWALPNDIKRSQMIMQRLEANGQGPVAIQGCAEGDELENDDEFIDAQDLEQYAAEDEANYDSDDQISVAGKHNHNKSSISTPSSHADSSKSHILPSIEHSDMFGVYESDCETSASMSKLNKATSTKEIQSEAEDDEDYAESDASESSEDIVLPGRRQITAVKGVLTADPGMKVIRKNYGGKTVPVQVSIDESNSEDDSYDEDNSYSTDDNETDTDNTPARALVPYPAPAALINASYHKKPSKKWRLFEEDLVINHMLTIRDEGEIIGEERFRETCARLEEDNRIVRSWGAVKNFWNRTGRARSGFDERKNKKAPLATSQQGKKAQNKTGSKSKTAKSVPSATKTVHRSTASMTKKTPSKPSNKKSVLPSPDPTPHPSKEKSVTSRDDVAEASFSFQDVQKMQADFQAKMQAEFQVKMRAEMQALISAAVAQPSQIASSDVPTKTKKRSRDAAEELEEGQVADVKKPRPSALDSDKSSRHRIPERREDRERRPRTDIERMYSSRRDSPVTRRFNDNDHSDRSARGPRGGYYDRQENSRGYHSRSDYYRRNDSDRQYNDRRRSDLRY